MLMPHSRAIALAALIVSLLACAPAAEPRATEVAADEQALLGGPEAPRTPSPLAVFVRSEARIAADAAEIFDLIIDFDAYGEWNPWVVWAEGDPVVGGEVLVDVILGGRAQRYEHIVIAVEPHTRFCWRDSGWNSWFAYAQRCRTLTPQADGKTLLSVETFIDGPFAKLVQAFYGDDLQRGMNAETAALKARAEE
jgi:uncharacterized protein YndB with AHSA1/START domain